MEPELVLRSDDAINFACVSFVSGGIVVGLTLIWWPLWIVALLPYGLMVRHFARRLVWSNGYQDGDAGAPSVPTTEAGQ